MTVGLQEHSRVVVPVGPHQKDSARLTTLGRRLPCHPSSVQAARRTIDQLDAWLHPSLLADLRLLVSELVANSVKHGPRCEGSAIRLTLSIFDRHVRAEVHDDGRGFHPLPSCPPLDAPSGRGLYLVEQLASRWGVTGGDGTRVWFELEHGRSGVTHDPYVPSCAQRARPRAV